MHIKFHENRINSFVDKRANCTHSKRVKKKVRRDVRGGYGTKEMEKLQSGDENIFQLEKRYTIRESGNN